SACSLFMPSGMLIVTEPAWTLFASVFASELFLVPSIVALLCWAAASTARTRIGKIRIVALINFSISFCSLSTFLSRCASNQAPLTQVCPLAHGFPHAPQLPGSVCNAIESRSFRRQCETALGIADQLALESGDAG